MSAVSLQGRPGPTQLPSFRSALRTVLVARLSRLEGGPVDGEPLEILRRVVRRFGGRVARTSPGEIWAEMRSPTDALHCGGALHDALELERPGLPFEVELRVAITAGDCERRGGELRGAPVRAARALLSETPAGEVRFDRALLLSANRSEFDGEACTGGWSYRLLPPMERLFPCLPFHGLWLVRKTSLHARIAEGARIAGRWALAASRTRAFRTACLLLLLGLAILQFLPPSPKARVESALAAGRAAEAVLHAERWVGSRPDDPEAHLWKARAELEVHRAEAARASIESALRLAPGLAEDPEVAHDLVRLLEAKGADTTFVARYDTPAVEEALAAATSADAYWLRKNAARALEKMGREDRIDRIGLLLLDLSHPRSCGIRMRAARKLASLGTDDPRVLPALEQARDDRLPHAICNLRQVIDETISTLTG